MATTNNKNPLGSVALHPFFAIPDLGSDGDFEGISNSEVPHGHIGTTPTLGIEPDTLGGGSTDSDSPPPFADISVSDGDYGKNDFLYGKDTGSGGGTGGRQGGTGTGGNIGGKTGSGGTSHQIILWPSGWSFGDLGDVAPTFGPTFSGGGSGGSTGSDATDQLMTEIEDVINQIIHVLPTDSKFGIIFQSFSELIHNTVGGADKSTLQRILGILGDIRAIVKASEAIGGTQAMDFLAELLTALTADAISWEDAALILAFLVSNPDLDAVLLILGTIEAAISAFKLGKAIYKQLYIAVAAYIDTLSTDVQVAMWKLYNFMLTH